MSQEIKCEMSQELKEKLLPKNKEEEKELELGTNLPQMKTATRNPNDPDFEEPDENERDYLKKELGSLEKNEHKKFRKFSDKIMKSKEDLSTKRNNIGQDAAAPEKNDCKMMLKKSLDLINKQASDFLTIPTKSFSPSNEYKEVKNLVIFPDQTKFACCFGAKTIEIFDIYDEKYRRTHDVDYVIMSIAYNALKNIIVAAGSKGFLSIIDIEKSKKISQIQLRDLEESNKQIKIVAFSGEGNHIFFGSETGDLEILTLDKNNILLESRKTLVTHEEGTCSLAYYPPSKLYASGGNDSLIYLFNLSSDFTKAENKSKVDIHMNIVRSLVFSNDGKYLLSGSYDKTAKLYDLEQKKVIMTYFGHTDAVLTADISPDSRLVLTGSQDNSVKVYDRETGAIIWQHISICTEEIKHIKDGGFNIKVAKFLGDGLRIIAAGEDKIIKIHSINKKSFHRGHSRLLTEAGDECPINCLDLSLEHQLLLTGGDGTVRLYELYNAFELRKFEGIEGDTFVVKFSPDCKQVLTGGEDATLRIFDTFSGTLICSYKNYKRTIYSIIFLKDFEFAVGSEDKRVDIYNIFSQEHVRRIPAKSLRKSSDPLIRSMICCSDDMKWIVAGGYDVDQLWKINLYSTDGTVSKSVPNGLKVPRGTIDTMQIVSKRFLVANDTDNERILIFSIENSEKDTQLTFCKEIFMPKGLKIIAMTSSIDLIVCVTEEGPEKTPTYRLREMIINGSDSNEPSWKSCYQFQEIEKPSSAISFLDVDHLCLGTYAGIPKIFKLNKEKGLLVEKNFSNFSNKVKFLAINHLEQIAIIDEKRKIRIMDISSGKIKCISNKQLASQEVLCIKARNKLIEGFEDKIETLPIIEAINLTKKKNSPEIINEISQDLFLLVLNERVIQAISYENVYDSKEVQTKQELPVILVEFTRNEIFYCLDDGSFVVQSEEKSETFHTPDANCPVTKPILLCPTSLCLRKNNQNDINRSISNVLLVLYKDGSLFCFDLSDTKFSKSKVLNKLNEPLTCADKSISNSKIIMGGEDKIVRIFDVETKGEILFKGHEDKISDVSFFGSEPKYAVSASEDRVILVFDIDSSTVIFTITLNTNVTRVCTSPISDTLVIGTEAGIRIFERVLHPRGKIEKFCELYEKNDQTELPNNITDDIIDILPMNLNFSILHMKLAKSKPYEEIDILKDVAAFLGPDSKADPRAKRILCECVFRKDSITEISPWDVWVKASSKNSFEQVIYEKLLDILLCPQMLHVDKMENKCAFLQKVASWSPGRLAEVLDVFWKSADPITIKMNRMDSKMWLKYYWDQFLGIIDLIGIKSSKLMITNLPIVLHSKSPEPCTRIQQSVYEEICSRYQVEGDDNKKKASQKKHQISYVKISKIRLDEIINLNYYAARPRTDANPNPNDPIFLLELFSTFTPEDPVFKSELLAVVINYLWKLRDCIGFSYYHRVVIFFIFQFIICLNCLYFIPEREVSKGELRKSYEFATLTFESLIIFLLGTGFLKRLYKIFRIFQMYGKSNFKSSAVFSLWNLLDLLICIQGVAVFGLDIHWTANSMDSSQEKTLMKCLLALFFATTWFKLIEFARGFTRTSALLRLLYQVSIDMFVYLLIIMFMVVGLAFTSFILQNSYTENTLWHYFKISYGILIGNSGEFKDEKQALDGELYFILLFFASVYLVIIMLNLLIAIVNNSFGNVLAKEKQNEIFEKLKIIYDYIYEMNGEEKKRLKQILEGDYLFQLNDKNEEIEAEQQESKQNEIKEFLSEIKEKEDLLSSRMDSLEEKLLEQMKDIQVALKNLSLERQIIAENKKI